MQKAWLATMAKRKEMWAACFTWAFCTYGIHSTQCIEAIHSAIAQWCNVSMLLTRLLVSLDKHELMRVECSASNAHRVAFRRAGQLAAGVEPHPPPAPRRGECTSVRGGGGGSKLVRWMWRSGGVAKNTNEK